MALVILVRHGQTDENVSGKISGQGPAPLNARGKEQAQAAADVLTALGASRILTSPIVRARQTADILAERLQVDIEEMRDLREVEYGDWEGQYFRDIRSHPVAHQVFNDPITIAVIRYFPKEPLPVRTIVKIRKRVNRSLFTGFTFVNRNAYLARSECHLQEFCF